MARGQQSKVSSERSVQDARDELIIQLEGEITEKETQLESLRDEIPRLKREVIFLKKQAGDVEVGETPGKEEEQL